MSGFAIRTPYLIIVSCLIILVLGVSSVARMPVDMFPSMNIPVVDSRDLLLGDAAGAG